ncbi:PLP-dependent aminotransferase family protein [Octadecabacter sp. 1_MG-2023]|uniref:MocR-like pyridoxine biosynthesis transcription factor PdxR n=1 Tax=unclassified Octadecabacter TaxID=196158 RepID=UPI001C095D16|nr:MULTISPECIES: PLP-dependent aminotransferase family protein [unclassified Octadecabacter]MBU2994263.1 PLP-dependent aminotransferase family protein [Octadecabacter sp. B2R22]MDO6734448.1 PLP-dependent aminotransferase family protein [Octadecabacter sp. 1_MG-2023]
MALPVETFFLESNAEGTLQTQIRQLVAEGILTGRFRAGEKLPSSRKLAHHLGVSRITVTLAFTELLADDYIVAKGRSGYFVSDNAPEPPAFPATASENSTVDWTRAIGQKFTTDDRLTKPSDWASYRYPFIYGQADPTLFDTANWRLCALEALGRKDFGALTADYFDTDDPKLLDFIARQTLPRRGILAKPDEILLTLGAQNALWLTAQVLLTQRRTAAIEDPCYPNLRGILEQSRCHLHSIPVDSDGLPPDALPDGTDVVFTTPSHQCPTAATMTMARRRALLDKAEADDFIIVEDDYEFEMSFLKPPSPALKSLDQNGRVIYVGSFSKSIFPGLRLGYLVGPAPFIREARALRASVLRHPPGHIQRTVTYFLSRGHYDALVRRMSRAFHDRRKVMDQAVHDHDLRVAGAGSFGGSAQWMRAPDHINTADLAERLRPKGVLIEPGQKFFAGEDAPQNYYRLAYSSIPSSRIAQGIDILARTLQEMG